jgi:hypothetical protein
MPSTTDEYLYLIWDYSESDEVYLLDDYPGAAVAYSVRKLRSTYIGSAMRVRRTVAPFDETDIGFDSNGDLDTAAIVAFGGSDSLTVSVWYDQSGSSNDASQATASNQRKIFDSSTGVMTYGGKPGLFRTITDGQLVHDIGSGTTWTSFAAVKIDSFPFGVHSRVPFSPWWYLADGSTGSLTSGFSNVSLWIDSTSSAAVSRLDLQNDLGTNHRLITARGDLTETGTNQWRVGSAYGTGGAYNVKGYMQEVIIYPSDQTSNLTGIETNINTYFSIYP